MLLIATATKLFVCSYPGAANILLGLRTFRLLQDTTIPAGKESTKNDKPAGAAGASAGASTGLVTDLSKAQPVARSIDLQALQTLARQLATFNDTVRDWVLHSVVHM